jgi:5-methylcytosine-specific restriction endonuclease McrA
MGASVDHIMPRSLGGGNEMANLRLLTWKCNNRRGNRGGNEQLALIG